MLLDIQDLYVGFPSEDGMVNAVNKIDLSLEEGDFFGVLGESGSGKTVLGHAIMQLLKEEVKIAGTVTYKGEDLMNLKPEALRKIRGKELGMIMQNPGASLNPSLSIGYQIAEGINVHNKMSKSKSRGIVASLLEKVEINNPRVRMKEYPHQFSGGMQERAIIAMGIVGSPHFILADEPTKGLDTLAKYKVLKLLKEISQDKTMMMITHDLDVAQELCSHIGILYLGEFVEISSAKKFFEKQNHPYTQGFFKSMPKNGMHPILGNLDSLIEIPKGCRFHPRCPHRMEKCLLEHPKMIQFEEGVKVRCFLYA